MVVETCPRCQQHYNRDKFNTDFVHECNSNNLILDQEDVLVIGNWEDYTGTGEVNKSQTQVAGLINRLEGTEAFYQDCERLGEFTVRGAKAGTKRQRQHLEYIDLKDSCKNSGNQSK